MVEGDRTDLGPVAIDDVDHAVRQPGFAQQLQRQVRDQGRALGRLPHHRVAEHRRAEGEVVHAGEVERRDREDESLERTVFGGVPLTRT